MVTHSMGCETEPTYTPPLDPLAIPQENPARGWQKFEPLGTLELPLRSSNPISHTGFTSLATSVSPPQYMQGKRVYCQCYPP